MKFINVECNFIEIGSWGTIGKANQPWFILRQHAAFSSNADWHPQHKNVSPDHNDFHPDAYLNHLQVRRDNVGIAQYGTRIIDRISGGLRLSYGGIVVTKTLLFTNICKSLFKLKRSYLTYKSYPFHIYN